MALADISEAATRRRLQDIADESRKAFESHVRRSAEIDAAAREAAAREEADLRAVGERRAEIEARRAAEQEKQDKQDKPTPRPRPATLSLGAEEFKLEREARKAAEKVTPARPAAQGKPAGKRPPRPEGDDDLSGRTWLR